METYHFGVVPFLVTERTDGSRFEPSLDTVQMKDMGAGTEGDGKTIVIGRGRIRLIFDRRFIERVSANGALK